MFWHKFFIGKNSCMSQLTLHWLSLLGNPVDLKLCKIVEVLVGWLFKLYDENINL